MIRTLLALAFIAPSLVFSQTKEPANGAPLAENNSFVLTNVKIIISPERTIENGDIYVLNGKIEDIGTTVNSPKNIPVIDGNHAVVVASFLELNSNLGLPENGKQALSVANGTSYWNDAIRPEYDPSNTFQYDNTGANLLLQMGFGLALTHQGDGLAQGLGTLIALNNSNKSPLVKTQVAGFYSFEKGSSRLDYPSSQVGCIALLRQSFYDAEYHKKYHVTNNYSLDALIKQESLPCFFSAPDQFEVLRAHAIASEFKRTFIVIGSGHEYELGSVWDTLKSPLVLPLKFPESYDLKDPYIARQIPLSDLKHWELAPTNPSVLAKAKVPFSLSTNGIKSASEFWANLHKALASGLTVSDAIKALTVTPAELIGVNNEYGTLEKGKKACFTVYDKDPFLYQSKVLISVIEGERIQSTILPEADIRGVYSMNIDGVKYWLDLKGAPDKLEAKISFPRTINDTVSNTLKADTLYADGFISYTENDIILQFVLKQKSGPQNFSLKGVMNTRVFIMEGDGNDSKGKWIKWSAIRNKKFEGKEELKQAWELDTVSKGKVTFPNMAYGFSAEPKKEIIIIENVTIWTNESEGIISDATVIVENGKIKNIIRGSGGYIKPKDARIIDGKGKVLTSGIIDEHSHIALSKGVNEGGQAVTAEVRMGDVIDAADIDVYRQLSGGVTAAQLLHGSANPVGGQSALIKLKWGHLPSDYLIPNAPKFVKFALGENVKQSNWGDNNSYRFPQTRMGVEQVYIDGFSRALAYHDALEKANSGHKHKEKTSLIPPPKDLELDALYEIVKGERRITCHSYIQSEINMLMHVADSFGFKVNTFTHILEGYKLADKMAAHGVGASTFADWWAYKYEVKEAIPFNAALLTNMGVVVAINSDDAEMGRRLNQEAAKTVKYGGMTEEQAWKMVTLNPAILLKLDKQMGSVKVGKDADLVLWTGNPLSIGSQVLYTIVDGEVLFDRELDYQMQLEIEKERARIITAMFDSSKRGETVRPFFKKRKGHFHCNTLGEEKTEGENQH